MANPHSRLPRDPLSPIPPSRHPFQFWILMACLITGWIVLLEDPNTEFSETLPEFTVYVWGLLMIMSSSVALLSAWWDDRITGLLLERSSLYGLAAALSVYGGFLFYAFGMVGYQSVLLNLGGAAACLWRCRHVKRELAVLRRLIRSREINSAKMTEGGRT